MSLFKNLKTTVTTGLNKTLASVQAKVNDLKTKTGAAADKLKKSIAKDAQAYMDNALFMPLMPLLPTMIILLKAKKEKITDTSIGGVARQFYRVYVDATASLESLEANFEETVIGHLDENGPTAGGSLGVADIAAVNDKIAGATSTLGEVKDVNNQAGKTAGAAVAAGLGLAGVPIPPAVGQAVGGTVQGIIRGIINFFKRKKAEGNKEVIGALKEGAVDVDKLDVTSGEPVKVKGDMKPIIYTLLAIVVVVIGYKIFTRKKA
jgi:hypothetical protein